MLIPRCLVGALALTACASLGRSSRALEPTGVVGQDLRSTNTARRTLVGALDSIARAAVERGDVTGRSVGVVRGRDTLLLRAYGRARIEPSTPTPNNAVYEIGSVTKQFTAAAVLMLVERGKVDIDAEITRYFPEYPVRGRHITVRQLLNHTAGIKGYTEMPAFDDIRPSNVPRDSLVNLFAAEPFTFEPGTAQMYSNSGYFLAGRLIEKISGQPYEDFVEREIFARLGMAHSAYCGGRHAFPTMTTGYATSERGLVPSGSVNHRWPYAAGSLCSSAGDMVRWLRALHGGKVLSPAMYRVMITPGKLTDGTVLRHAMGLYVGDDAAGHATIGHGGAIRGFLSETRYYPAHDLYIVVLQNTNGGSAPEVVADDLAERILGRRPETAGRVIADLGRYVGTYVGPTRERADGSIQIAHAGGQLTYRLGDAQPSPLRHLKGHTFEASAPRSGWPYTRVHLTFREVAGRVAELRFDTGFGHAVMIRR